ncbi:unnamed protein product [Pieris macdunnoughi]|uniref:Uncharacterized protein n=1 Tax=Pieris macdunnoughi TaxID=345717 RepID=A0A821TSH1_9NEOP|nr:unnamed protein product [Pieris macdunnoughi]
MWRWGVGRAGAAGRGRGRVEPGRRSAVRTIRLTSPYRALVPAACSLRARDPTASHVRVYSHLDRVLCSAYFDIPSDANTVREHYLSERVVQRAEGGAKPRLRLPAR